MDSNTTIHFDISEVNDEVVKSTLRDVLESLEERGYNPINQIVGYISSYKEARNKIAKIDRTVLVEVLLKNYLK